VTASLAHEPVFNENTKALKSYTTSQKPDIVLKISIPSHDYGSDGQSFIWVFDAKYRIKAAAESYEDKDDIDNVDYVPNDALNQMHRYRDALFASEVLYSSDNETLVGKSRPVIGAFALYPGYFNQKKERNPYADAIQEIGIGAFALLPSHDGGVWLADFLRQQISQHRDNQDLVESYYL